jgi:hypothetical protein
MEAQIENGRPMDQLLSVTCPIRKPDPRAKGLVLIYFHCKLAADASRKAVSIVAGWCVTTLLHNDQTKGDFMKIKHVTNLLVRVSNCFATTQNPTMKQTAGLTVQSGLKAGLNYYDINDMNGGSFELTLPDGRIQTITYNVADATTY